MLGGNAVKAVWQERQYSSESTGPKISKSTSPRTPSSTSTANRRFFFGEMRDRKTSRAAPGHFRGRGGRPSAPADRHGRFGATWTRIFSPRQARISPSSSDDDACQIKPSQRPRRSARAL